MREPASELNWLESTKFSIEHFKSMWRQVEWTFEWKSSENHCQHPLRAFERLNEYICIYRNVVLIFVWYRKFVPTFVRIIHTICHPLECQAKWHFQLNGRKKFRNQNNTQCVCVCVCCICSCSISTNIFCCVCTFSISLCLLQTLSLAVLNWKANCVQNENLFKHVVCTIHKWLRVKCSIDWLKKLNKWNDEQKQNAEANTQNNQTENQQQPHTKNKE